MKIYTVNNGVVTPGATKIEKRLLKGVNTEINVISVGETGRGRSEGWLVIDPTALPRAEKRTIKATYVVKYNHKYQYPDVAAKDVPSSAFQLEGPLFYETINGGSIVTPPATPPIPEDWQEKWIKNQPSQEPRSWFIDTPVTTEVKVEFIPNVIFSGSIGQTKSGKPKLILDNGIDHDQVLLVMPTKIGYRGSNSHTGDKASWSCSSWFCRSETGLKENSMPAPDKCPICGASLEYNFLQFPGKVLCDGRIAQGEAGGAGAGTQLICTMPVGSTFRTSYGGRLYGSPSSHYFFVRNENEILAATPKERAVVDLF